MLWSNIVFPRIFTNKNKNYNNNKNFSPLIVISNSFISRKVIYPKDVRNEDFSCSGREETKFPFKVNPKKTINLKLKNK